MKYQLLKNLVAIIVITIIFSRCSPYLIDISPNRNNGISDGDLSTAGLILNIAGDKNGLYAIGLNSGVWKTEINNDNSFDKWIQLPQSPRYAHCIAVDEQFPGHIAVGEREGDATNMTDNKCGLWESYDGGKTFEEKHYFNPLGRTCTNSSHVINSVVITNKSTTLISTPCGIGRKGYFESSFSFPSDVSNQNFTAIATFKDWIVARTHTSIFISNDDGKKWNEYPIQFNFSSQDFVQSDIEGTYSVCILQDPKSDIVFVYLPVTRNPNRPCIGSDKGIDPCTGIGNDPPTCNYGSYLVFSNKTKTWNYQILNQTGLGIGLGGRVFMKSFFSFNNNLKDEIGGNSILLYCSSQNVFSAKSIDLNGIVEFENIANANICGATNPSNFHSDIWDYLIDPLGWYAWVSCDGGVYYVKMNDSQTYVNLNNEQKYLNLNQGLHTQHIHSMFVAETAHTRSGGTHVSNPVNSAPQPSIIDTSKDGTVSVTPPSNKNEEFYGYGTQDNDAWKKGLIDWIPIGGTGDANWVAGDQGNTSFILSARHFQNAVLDKLKITGLLPAGSSPNIGMNITLNNDLDLNDDLKFNGLQCFQFIQSTSLETPPPFLDAVMLTSLPVKYHDGKKLNNVDGILGSTSGDTVIIRNKEFAKNPDMNVSKGVGWEIEFNDLPHGVRGFWVSDGHSNPSYYLYCVNSGVAEIYKRDKNSNSWSRLNITNINDMAEFGPVFVNPYNSDVIYVSCTNGIFFSDDGGDSPFIMDQQLTNLVSGNGKYPINRTFSGGNSSWVSRSTQANSMCPVSCISFNRFNPNQIVASSPFTGVFFKDGSKGWKDFSDLLPKPFTPVSSVSINNEGIYVSTEGRGVFLIKNY